MKYLIILTISLLIISCNTKLEIKSINEKHNAYTINNIDISPPITNYLYYEIKNYKSINNYKRFSDELVRFIDNKVTPIAIEKKVEINCYFYPYKWYKKYRININDGELVSDNGLLYDENLIALIIFKLNEEQEYIREIIIYENHKIVYAKSEIL